MPAAEDQERCFAALSMRVKWQARIKSAVRLLDVQDADDAEDVWGGNVVEGVLVFLFEALAEIKGGDVTGFAVAEISFGAVAEGDKRGMREAQDHGFSIHVELAIHGIAVARGDRVPAMRKGAAIDAIGDLGRNIEGADEFAHGAGVGNGGRTDFGHRGSILF